MNFVLAAYGLSLGVIASYGFWLLRERRRLRNALKSSSK